MADKKTYTGLSKNYLTVPAYSVSTVEYLDTKPNYFRVQNRGLTELYCSTSNIPNTKVYDFDVGGKKSKMFSEPYFRTRLYIFNPSGTPIEVAVLSFQADFDPLALAMSEIEVEVPESIIQSLVISGFNTSLPSGTNALGKVEVTNQPTAEITDIKNSLSALSADVTSIKSKMQNSFSENISAINQTIESGSFYLDTPGKMILHMLTNDGATDMEFLIKPTFSSPEIAFLLKPGESITDFKVLCYTASIRGKAYPVSFRALISSEV